MTWARKGAVAARAALLVLALALSACSTLEGHRRDRVDAVVAAARRPEVACTAADRCAQPSPLRTLGVDALAQSSADAPRHYALIIDRGPDAMLARLDLIRGAQHRVVQPHLQVGVHRRQRGQRLHPLQRGQLVQQQAHAHAAAPSTASTCRPTSSTRTTPAGWYSTN